MAINSQWQLQVIGRWVTHPCAWMEMKRNRIVWFLYSLNVCQNRKSQSEFWRLVGKCCYETFQTAATLGRNSSTYPPFSDFIITVDWEVPVDWASNLWNFSSMLFPSFFPWSSSAESLSRLPSLNISSSYIRSYFPALLKPFVNITGTPLSCKNLTIWAFKTLVAIIWIN